MIPWWAVLIIVLVGVLLLFIAVRLIMRSVNATKARHRIASACSPAVLQNQGIFVTLVADPESVPAAVQTLLSLFTAADCPLRVHVGLVEFVNGGPDAPSRVLPAYTAAANARGVPFNAVDDNIRRVQVPVSESKGTFAARALAEKYLFRGEAYVAAIDAGVDLARGWDKYVVALCEGSRKNGSSKGSAPPGNTVFVSKPPNAAAAKADVRAPGSYVVVGPGTDLHTNFAPDLVTAQMHKLVHDPVPAVAWCSGFVFSRAARLQDAPLPRDVVDADGVEEVVTGALVAAAGWKFAHPPGQVAVRSRSARSAQRSNPESTANVLAAYRDIITRYVSSLGIDVPAGGVVSSRARLGLTTDTPDASEVAAKFGGMSQFTTVLSRLTVSPSGPRD